MNITAGVGIVVSPRRTLAMRAARLGGAAIIAAAVAGCASDNITTGSVNPSAKPIAQMNKEELRGAMASYRQRYEQNPQDKRTAIAYASILGMNGYSEQAVAVMRKAAIIHSEDREVLAAFGKALAGAGDFTAALDAIQRAQDPTQPDWRLLSAEGAIYDQTGRPEQARIRYRKALDLAPNEPSVLSNLAMSLMLEGELDQAEQHLRTAVKQPGADSRVRQNLALVVGLQGRFAEAEAIARRELSPQQAQANVAYLRDMLSQQNAWGRIKQEDRAQTATN